MSALSDSLEHFIKDMLELADDGTFELQRNKVAKQFNCAPSQINYVLQTRFPSSRGYYVESKRGGGGYIKIVKIDIDEKNDFEKLIFDTVGDSITKDKADYLIDGFYSEGLIGLREMRIMKISLSDRSLTRINQQDRNYIRADMIKNMLLAIAEQ